MFTPNPSTKTTAPKKNLLTQLTDALTGFFSPKKEPESSTPNTEPDNSAPTGSTPQSEGQPSNAAADVYALSAVSPMTCRARSSSRSSSVRPSLRRVSSLCWPSVGAANR